jgi:DNA modification methylase
MKLLRNKQALTLINDDCRIALKKIKDNSVDLILTDPPYNIGRFANTRGNVLKGLRDNRVETTEWDNISPDAFLELMDTFICESARILRPVGSLIVFFDYRKIQTMMSICDRYGFYYKTTGIWHKRGVMPRNMNIRFCNSTEPWLYYTYGGKTGTFNNAGKCIHDYIETTLTPASEKRMGKHPTQKPIALMEHFVEILTNEGDTVLDPFMGTGTCGVASRKLNRNFIGVEAHAPYFEIAEQRINALPPQYLTTSRNIGIVTQEVNYCEIEKKGKPLETGKAFQEQRL